LRTGFPLSFVIEIQGLFQDFPGLWCYTSRASCRR